MVCSIGSVSFKAKVLAEDRGVRFLGRALRALDLQQLRATFNFLFAYLVSLENKPFSRLTKVSGGHGCCPLPGRAMP